jgi:hypothetical protein
MSEPIEAFMEFQAFRNLSTCARVAGARPAAVLEVGDAACWIAEADPPEVLLQPDASNALAASIAHQVCPFMPPSFPDDCRL